MTKLGLLGTATSALLVGCGSGGVDLDQLRAESRPYFWVGPSFQGLPVTHVDSSGRFSTLIYGTCTPTGGEQPSCTPPLEIQNARCSSGGTNVAIFGRSKAMDARAAKALRPLNRAARTGPKPIVTLDRSILC